MILFCHKNVFDSDMFMDIIYMLKIIKISIHYSFFVERQTLELLISYHGSISHNMKYNKVSCYFDLFLSLGVSSVILIYH